MKSGANERRKNFKKGKDEDAFSGESDRETIADEGNNVPPFLPLEATTEAPPPHIIVFLYKAQDDIRKFTKSCNGKKIVSGIMFALIGLIIWDAVFTDPADRLLRPDFADTFLRWVQGNPTQGIFAFLIVIATAVIFMIPIGTPLTLGCGYIYKAAYGWTWGLTLATIVSMAGSALGAVACFLLGRYLMREQVRLWVRKYPLFDAIDIGKSFLRDLVRVCVCALGQTCTCFLAYFLSSLNSTDHLLTHSCLCMQPLQNMGCASWQCCI